MGVAVTRLAFNLSTGADTGGAAIREVEAFKAHPPVELTDASDSVPRYLDRKEWTVHAMVAATNYIGYTQDVPYSVQALLDLYDRADVVHLNHTLHGHTWYDRGQGKPIVLEHHGLHKGSFDIDFESSIAAGIELGATQIGSTVNLELYAPPGVISWAPIPYDLQSLRDLRKKLFKPSPSVIRIGHAPTVRAVKSTETVINAVETLKKRGFPVQMVLIEHQTHEETLKLKAGQVDIYVDQLKLGYGCNAIECWGMGIPVVAGVSDYPDWRDHMIRRFGAGRLPFFEANEENLVERLAAIVASPFLQETWSMVGLAHAFRFHDQVASVHQMSAIYDRAAERHSKINPAALLLARGALSHEERLRMLRAARRSH